MKHRIVTTSIALSISLLAAPALLAAPISGLNPSVHAMFGSAKMISFSLKNVSKTPLTVKAGDQTFVIQPGEKSTFKLAPGTQVTTVNDTTHHTAGSVLTTADIPVEGTTLTID